MAVQPGPTEKRYAANGVSLMYTVPFLVIEAGDLQVLLNGVQLTSGFTHVGVGLPISYIEFTVPPTGDLLLQLSVPFQRLVDYQENGDFLSSTVNRDFDRIWQALKQLLRTTSRSPVLGVNDIDGQGFYRAKGNGLVDLASAGGNPTAAANWKDVLDYVGQILETGQGPINNAANVVMVGANGYVGNVQNLAGNDGTDVGAAMVGFFRSAASLPGNVGDQLRGQAIQLLEYIPKSQHAAIKAGTSVYDATTKVQAAIDYAASIGASIVHDFGTVVIDCVILKAGLRGFFGNGTIKTNTLTQASGQGVLIVQGSFYGPTFTGIDSLYMGGLTIDCNNGLKRGFFGSSVTNSRFDTVKVQNIGVGAGCAGLRLMWDSNDNVFQYCVIRMPVISDSTSECYGIQINGNAIDGYGGYGSGNFIAPNNRCFRNQIFFCKTFNGTHGISVNASEKIDVIGNQIENPAHRAIHMSPQVRYGLIANNDANEFGSSAIILGYNCTYIKIVGNRCFSTTPGGEAGIQAYVGCQHITIDNNTVRSAGNFGIYAAIDPVYIRIINNDIDGSALKKAAIAVESEWAPGQVSPFLYARPNYGAPPSPRSTWANGNGIHVTIKGNAITAGAAGTAAIYIAQVGATAGLDLVYVNNNDIESSTFTHTFYFVETTPGKLVRQVCNGNNSSLQEVGKAYATRGRAHFNSMIGNDTFNGEMFYSGPTNVQTPSVFPSDKLSIANYTAATNVTNFAGGKEGQRITVRLGPNITLVHNPAALSLKGGTNLSGLTTTVFMDFMQTGGVWFEQSRNF